MSFPFSSLRHFFSFLNRCPSVSNVTNSPVAMTMMHQRWASVIIVVLLWSDIALALWWIACFIAVLAIKEDYFLDIVVFAFHFAGFFALVSIYDFKRGRIKREEESEDNLTLWPWLFASMIALITDTFTMIDFFIHVKKEMDHPITEEFLPHPVVRSMVSILLILGILVSISSVIFMMTRLGVSLYSSSSFK